MKEILLFYRSDCPYCRQAFQMIDELCGEYSELAAIPVRRIEERQQAALAEQYDYWYVPSLFLGDQKLHEGVPTREKIEQALRAAL